MVTIKYPRVAELLKDNTDFGKIFAKNYHEIIADMQAGSLIPPIAGKNKGKIVVDEKKAVTQAINKTFLKLNM